MRENTIGQEGVINRFDSGETKELIRNNSDMVEVISEYVTLKKRGSNYQGLCPFHSEKTPSFSVSPGKQIFHCFGCGAGGDIFEFISKIENLNFFESLERLGKRCGISVRNTGKTSTDYNLKIRIHEVNRKAAEFYRNSLLESQEGKRAVNYMNKRGITKESLSLFMVGYAGASWDKLHTFLKENDVPLDLQEKAGLIRKNEPGSGYRDRFRNRIIFPIFEAGGEIIGFAGRVLSSDENRPKYLNSPETLTYKKARVLYGLNLAKECIRKSQQAILVEGYMDLIALSQAGIGNVIATSGTAITEQHVHLIKRFTDSVVMVFDGDSAGIKAAKKGCILLSEEGISVKVVELSNEMDPDSFIRREGKDEFLKLIEKSLPFMEYLIEKTCADMNGDSIDEKVKTINFLLPYFAKRSNAIERGYYISKVAERLCISESSIQEELNKHLKGESSRKGLTVKSNSSVSKTERILIQLMLKDFSNVDKIKKNIYSTDFHDPCFFEIAKALYSLPESEKFNTGDLLNLLKSEGARRIVTEFSLEDILYDDADELIEGCLRDIRRKKEKLSGQWKAKNSQYDRIRALRNQLEEIKQNNNTMH